MTDVHQKATPEAPHTSSVEAWDAIAALYDEHVAPGESDLATAGLRLAGLRAGHTFLDVAAGPGGLSLPAARLRAKVLATDWSPKMIEHFNGRVAAERLDAEGRVMDCHALDVADESYDITGSLFGVMLVPDQAQALREMVRVTKPGGRVLLIAYGDPQESRHCTSSSPRCRPLFPGSKGPRRTSRSWSSRSPIRMCFVNGCPMRASRMSSWTPAARSGSKCGPGSSCGTGALAATPSRACWLRT